MDIEAGKLRGEDPSRLADRLNRLMHADHGGRRQGAPPHPYGDLGGYGRRRMA